MAGQRDKYGLTPKQAKAVEHYVVSGNMSEAYRSAYACENMKPNTISRNAFELFQRPNVAARVLALREEMDKASELSRSEALQILTRIARGELGKYLDEEGHIRPERLSTSGPDLESYSEDQGMTGSGDEAMITLSRKLKVRNPIQAIERIAKMCGWDKQRDFEAEGITINIDVGEHD